jgi:hypothetical protein
MMWVKDPPFNDAQAHTDDPYAAARISHKTYHDLLGGVILYRDRFRRHSCVKDVIMQLPTVMDAGGRSGFKFVTLQMSVPEKLALSNPKTSSAAHPR